MEPLTFEGKTSFFTMFFRTLITVAVLTSQIYRFFM